MNDEFSGGGHEAVGVVSSTSAPITGDQVSREAGLVEASAEGRQGNIRRDCKSLILQSLHEKLCIYLNANCVNTEGGACLNAVSL